MVADAEKDQVDGQDQPVDATRLTAPLQPDQGQPGANGHIEHGQTVDFGFDGVEPEGIGEGQKK